MTQDKFKDYSLTELSETLRCINYLNNMEFEESVMTLEFYKQVELEIQERKDAL